MVTLDLGPRHKKKVDNTKKFETLVNEEAGQYQN